MISIVTAQDVTTRLISLEDDPSLPIVTFRLCLLGLGLASFSAILAQIFYFRPQVISISGMFLLIISYALGSTLEIIVPGPYNKYPWLKTSNTSFWRFMNPGPYNIKEHAATTILAGTAATSALGINILAADALYYGFEPNAALGIFTLLGSQLLGYSFAGAMQSFLLYPTYILFPPLIVGVQVFDCFHRDPHAILHKKRIKVFWLVVGMIFLWEFIPQFIAPTMTGISIFCLVNRNNAWFTRIFGKCGTSNNEGLGLFSISLDWNYITGASGSMYNPLSMQMSLYFGTLICIISSCALYAKNTWKAQNFPFLSQALFNEDGTLYDELAILDSHFRLIPSQLAEQGLPWLAPTNVLSAIALNLSIGATVSHVILWYWKDIKLAIKEYRHDNITDLHFKKMKVYREVPFYWYCIVFVASFTMAITTTHFGASELPWWGLIIAIVISVLFLPFLTLSEAITSFAPNLDSLIQMIGASIFPGNPQTNMYFTLYGSTTLYQALGFLIDLKLAQYLKLPFRICFFLQCIGTIIGAILNYIIMKIIIHNEHDILLSIQGSHLWSGQQVQLFNAYAVTWGALGKYLYSPQSQYSIVPFCIVIGIFIPIPFWIIHQYWPQTKANQVLTPVICYGIGFLSIGINSSVFVAFILAIIFQFYLRNYHPAWFQKYNYIIAAGLDGGTQIMVFVSTFALNGAGAKSVTMPTWALNPIGNSDYCLDTS
ncbi:peptide transporter MTD1 [Mycena floridula]|nr:peptide transporter MTD1 [Mycena floridula]